MTMSDNIPNERAPLIKAHQAALLMRAGERHKINNSTKESTSKKTKSHSKSHSKDSKDPERRNQDHYRRVSKLKARRAVNSGVRGVGGNEEIVNYDPIEAHHAEGEWEEASDIDARTKANRRMVWSSGAQKVVTCLQIDVMRHRYLEQQDPSNVIKSRRPTGDGC